MQGRTINRTIISPQLLLLSASCGYRDPQHPRSGYTIYPEQKLEMLPWHYLKKPFFIKYGRIWEQLIWTLRYSYSPGPGITDSTCRTRTQQLSPRVVGPDSLLHSRGRLVMYSSAVLMILARCWTATTASDLSPLDAVHNYVPV